MAESKYLTGKVVKWSLPVISGRPGPDAPILKRLLLPQGELAQVHDSDEGICYLAVIETRMDSVRGNHYHKVKEELIYVLQGELLVVVEDIGTNERASVPLRTGDLLRIQTGIAHLLRTVAPGQAIEFSRARFSAADIFPFALG
jgi:mannose-6-phosphate isomerase-like protein (cupin superfamily)